MRVLNSFSACYVLGFEVHLEELDCSLLILNIYGPYENKFEFWQSLMRKDFTKVSNVIVGGDLNFTLSFEEIWGEAACLDPLGPLLGEHLEKGYWMDIKTSELKPTWCNKRTSSQGIYKRLDHFLMTINLVGLL